MKYLYNFAWGLHNFIVKENPPRPVKFEKKEILHKYDIGRVLNSGEFLFVSKLREFFNKSESDKVNQIDIKVNNDMKNDNEYVLPPQNIAKPKL